MTARIPAQLREPQAWLDPPLPESIVVGDGTAFVVSGSVECRTGSGLRLRAGRAVWPVETAAPPRGGGPGRPRVWWALVRVPPPGPGEVSLALALQIGDEEVPLGEIALAEPPAPADSVAAIAICMATYEPEPERLLRQIDSIRAQDRDDWVCLISDDASSPEALAGIERAIGDDARFVLSRSGRRLGFYANFERALAMAPAGATHVALCDQDDRWHPDKLSSLAATLEARPDALLAYSDMRIADGEGRILSDSYWYLHQNACDDIASLAIVNTVTGAASLFRRELLDLALPFPPGTTVEHYHDHWLALCALATGEIAYLDRSTYDYTRHTESVTLSSERPWFAPPRNMGERVAIEWRRWTRRARMGTTELGWRGVYFERVLLMRQYVAVLEMRAWPLIAAGKRRDLSRLAKLDSSPRAAAWLLARAFRPLKGRNETIGRERVLLGALLWRALSRRS